MAILFFMACLISPSACVVQAFAANAAAPLRPNILWISCEDISADLGCYGDTYARTPTLDRFSQQGTRFTNVFGVAGVCAVNRSCIITGMYPTTIGTHHMRCRAVPPPEVHCFTEYLRAAGYFCSNQSKTDYNFDNPVTAWDESSKTAHWRDRAQGQPFFCVINLTVTHESKIRAPEEKFATLTKKLTAEQRHDPARAPLPPFYPDTPTIRRDVARYYDLVTAMDRQVAKILEQLEKDGLREDTIVIYWSDHGRGLPRYKRWIYDTGLHVPMIVRWPGVLAPGSVDDRLVSFVDFAPTVLSLAGVSIPKPMQGRAFLGEQTGADREFIFAARDRMDETYDIIRAVRDERYKYLRNYEPSKPYAQTISYMEQMPTMQELRKLHAAGKLTGPQKLFFADTKPVEELYDTRNDPYEIHNLANDANHADVLARMRVAHEAWRKETADVGLIPEAEIWERMRPGGAWQVTKPPAIAIKTSPLDAHDKLSIVCPTEGASIAYTTETGKNPHWLLYTDQIDIPQGSTVRAKAIRLGYRESAEVRKRVAMD